MEKIRIGAAAAAAAVTGSESIWRMARSRWPAEDKRKPTELAV